MDNLYKEILFPEFKSGTILKSEDLKALRDGIWDYMNIKYRNYSDGIIKGFDVIYEENKINISGGILKHKNEIYFTTKNVSVNLPKEENTYYIYLNLIKESTKKQIFLSVETKEDKNKIELARINLRENSIINNYYDNIFTTDSLKYNTINVEYKKISSPFNSNVINPSILKIWTNEMFKKKNISDLDLNVLSIIVQSEYLIDTRLIIAYIEKKNMIRVENRLDILDNLRKILESDREENEIKLSFD